MKLLFLTAVLLIAEPIEAGAKYEATLYAEEQKVVFDFFLDDPAKTSAALFWLRSYINPLQDDPYGHSPEFMDIKVIIHGTELVTVAKKNYAKYRTVVDRMRYYADLGVEFRVCAIAAADYDYNLEDFQDFIVMSPSAITELGHRQQQGYALIRPVVHTKTKSVEEIR